MTGFDDWLPLLDYAALHGVHHNSLRRAIKDGRLPAKKRWGAWLVHRQTPCPIFDVGGRKPRVVDERATVPRRQHQELPYTQTFTDYGFAPRPPQRPPEPPPRETLATRVLALVGELTSIEELAVAVGAEPDDVRAILRAAREG